MSDLPVYFDELCELVEAGLHGRMTADEAGRLDRILLQSAEARSDYVAMQLDAAAIRRLLCTTKAEQRRSGTTAEGTAPIAVSVDHGPVRPRVGPQGSFGRDMAYAMAAAVLLAAAVLAIYVAFFSDSSVSSSPDAPMPQPMMATVLDTAGGGTLVVNDEIASPGSDITRGSVTLDTGAAEFRLVNGVQVNLRGETELTIDDAMHATLARGEATFECPTGTKGYTVHLPGGVRVVDLGTVFTVKVAADGAISAWVTQGSIAVYSPTGATRTLAAGQTPYQVAALPAPPRVTDDVERIKGLAAWFAADEGVELGAGNLVTRWTSRVADATTGKPMVATPADAKTQPMLASGEMQNRAAIRFDGADDRLLTAARSWTPARTIVTVARAEATQPKNGGLAVNIGDYPAISMGFDGRWFAVRYVGKGSEQLIARAAADDAGQPTVAALVFDANTRRLDLVTDGERVQVGDPTTYLPMRSYPIAIGDHMRYVGRAFRGDIAEVLVFDRALSSGELKTVTDYLNEKYALKPGPDHRD